MKHFPWLIVCTVWGTVIVGAICPGLGERVCALSMIGGAFGGLTVGFFWDAVVSTKRR